MLTEGGKEAARAGLASVPLGLLAYQVPGVSKLIGGRKSMLLTGLGVAAPVGFVLGGYRALRSRARPATGVRRRRS